MIWSPSKDREPEIVKGLYLHRWDVSTEEAVAIQRRLAAEVDSTDGIAGRAAYVVGTDISPPDANGDVIGSAVVMRLPGLAVVEVACAQGRPRFPYVPGLLSFREAPLIMAALECLKHAPDFLIADGQGLAHPRRFGLACHLGVLTGLPAIGCAKSVLVGRYTEPSEAVGSWTFLKHRDEPVGAALRTRRGVKPLYVSVGHKVDLESAIGRVLTCCSGYRMPEPTRLAHLAAAGRLEQRVRAPVERAEET